MNPPNSVRIPTLFFDERGCGPDACDLALHPMKELEYEGKVIAKRSVGLRVFASQSGIGALMFATAGGFQLFEEQARELRDQLAAWLDAPRLEARKDPTVVHVDPAARLCLLSTSAGEWCIAEHHVTRAGNGGPDPETARWFETEEDARAEYLAERGRGVCEDCDTEVDADDLMSLDPDGDYNVCPPCHEKALAEFNAAAVEHEEQLDCTWKGKGSETIGTHEGPACPMCGELVLEASPPALELDDVTEDTRG